MTSVDWDSIQEEVERKLIKVSKEISKDLVREVRARFEKTVQEEVERRLKSQRNQNNYQVEAPSEKTTQIEDPRIQLDVGGKYFTTTISTLTKEADSMLSSMFGGRFPIQKNADGRVFIDREGSVFDLILDYLRDGKFRIPEDAKTMEKLLREVRYYGLAGMEDILTSDWRNPSNNNNTATIEQPAKKGEPTVFVVGEKMLQYNLISKQWTKGKTPLIDEHSYHGVVSCNNKIYVAGGNYPAIAQAEMFDPEKNEWKMICPMKQARYHFGLVTLGEKIYALGGIDKNTIEVYDPPNNSWSLLMEGSCSKHSFASTAWKGTIITSAGRTNGSTRIKSIEQYDPREGKWNILGEANPMSSHQLVSIDDRIYSIGGFDGEHVLSTVKYFDMKMRSWHSVCSMKHARSTHAAVHAYGKIIVVGGTNVAEEYDAELNLWNTLPAMPESVPKPGAACCWIET